MEIQNGLLCGFFRDTLELCGEDDPSGGGISFSLMNPRKETGIEFRNRGGRRAADVQKCIRSHVPVDDVSYMIVQAGYGDGEHDLVPNLPAAAAIKAEVDSKWDYSGFEEDPDIDHTVFCVLNCLAGTYTLQYLSTISFSLSHIRSHTKEGLAALTVSFYNIGGMEDNAFTFHIKKVEPRSRIRAFYPYPSTACPGKTLSLVSTTVGIQEAVIRPGEYPAGKPVDVKAEGQTEYTLAGRKDGAEISRTLYAYDGYPEIRKFRLNDEDRTQVEWQTYYAQSVSLNGESGQTETGAAKVSGEVMTLSCQNPLGITQRSISVSNADKINYAAKTIRYRKGICILELEWSIKKAVEEVAVYLCDEAVYQISSESEGSFTYAVFDGRPPCRVRIEGGETGELKIEL